MNKKVWSIVIDGSEYEIKLVPGFLSAKKTVYVNGQLVEEEFSTKQSLLGNSETDFLIGSHPIKIVDLSNGLSIKYDLFIDGKSFSTGKSYTPLPPIPFWLWFVAFACGIIPIISLGGAIPALLGVGGATICLSQCRDESKTIQVRVIICIGITILVWVLFAFLTLGVAFLRI